MEDYPTLRDYQQAADFVRQQTRHQPRIGMVLGSGLGDLADEVKDADTVDYVVIPGWPQSRVAGHSGQLIIGHLQGKSVMVMRGRAHYYEGYSMARVTLPIRVMQLLGIHTIILTNAAGGLRQDMRPGQMMLISDVINLIGMAGANPLRGPNDERLGTRFPDMTEVFDAELRAIAHRVALDAQLPLTEGVYAGLAGPSFETPADLRFLRLIGADAVGMSTVAEAIVARHGGIRLLGISGISNTPQAEPGSQAETTHDEVLEAGKALVPRLLTLIRGILQALPTG
jgi:purine-nucleoside phosphorylase